MPVKTDGDPRRGRLRGWRAPVAIAAASAAALGGLALTEGYNPFSSSTPAVATPQDLIANPGKYFDGKIVVVRPFTNSNAVPSLDLPRTIPYESSTGQHEALKNGVTGTLYSKSSFEGPSMPAIMSAGVQDNVEAAAQGENGRGKLPTISVEIVKLPDGEYAADIISAIPVFPKDFHFGQ